MNLFKFAGLAACVATVGCGPSNPALKAIVGATLVDGSGAAPVPDSVVIVNGNDFQAAGPRATTPIPPDASKIDEAGKFLVPGLIDVRTDIPTDAAKAAPILRSLVKAGITSVGVENGGSVSRDVSPRMLAASIQMAGFADLVIASGGNTPAGFFGKIDRMVKAEIAPQQILAAATKNGAAWLKQDRLGVIAPNRKADLLVLNADPTKDARNLSKVEKVMLDGTWVK